MSFYECGIIKIKEFLTSTSTLSRRIIHTVLLILVYNILVLVFYILLTVSLQGRP